MLEMEVSEDGIWDTTLTLTVARHTWTIQGPYVPYRLPLDLNTTLYVSKILNPEGFLGWAAVL